MRGRIIAFGALLLITVALHGHEAPRPDWARIEEETMRHRQALVRMDTSYPPGNEQPAADYLKPLFACSRPSSFALCDSTGMS